MDQKDKSNKDKTTLNVLLVQYAPITKNVKENIDKVDRMLEKFSKDDKIDIVVFPEMSFTGYIFDDRNDIICCLEEQGRGLSFKFCSELAKRLDAYVFCGYPEILRDRNNLRISDNEAEISETDKLYNACMVIDRNGNLHKNTRKKFLYKDDKTWSIEGDEFGYTEIETQEGKKVKVGIGICMDLNPYEFTAPYEKKEFANFCLEKKVDLIVFLTNWLNASEDDPKMFEETEERSYDLLNYWLDRCSPFLKSNAGICYFLAANRCGVERKIKFAGTSAIIKLAKKPNLIDKLTIAEENYILSSIELNL